VYQRTGDIRLQLYKQGSMNNQMEGDLRLRRCLLKGSLGGLIEWSLRSFINNSQHSTQDLVNG
jgi:hypothetical protein